MASNIKKTGSESSVFGGVDGGGECKENLFDKVTAYIFACASAGNLQPGVAELLEATWGFCCPQFAGFPNVSPMARIWSAMSRPCHA